MVDKIFPTNLSEANVKAIRAMTPEQLVLHAQGLDFAVLVESALRLDATTKRLNGILNYLTGALVFLTVGLVALTGVLVWQGFQPR